MPKYRCIVHYDMEMFVDAKNEIIAKFKASWRARRWREVMATVDRYAMEAFINAYGRTGIETLKVLGRYIKWRKDRFNKDSDCVTYEGLRKFITYAKLNVKFTTLERALRRMAEGSEPPVRRVKKGRKFVMFCINREHPVVQYIIGGEEQ